ncbi:MAG TPA: phage adsorption protein NrfB [Campylobacterales bacterium]|nr:phage adsorption protein NrfB [Campylobacterales bacterium]
MEAVDYLSLYWLFIKFMTFFAVVVLFISGMDDFFIDLYYWVRRGYRKAMGKSNYPEVSVQELMDYPEKPLALMVPAWDEAVVIEKMLKNTLRTFQYDNLHIFVGTYPNDLATQEKVDKVTAIHKNVHKVINKTPGPTTKADCLNNVIETIFAYEKRTKTKFACFTYHDSEDIVHPLELKLANYVVGSGERDLMQIPVVPLTRNPWNFNGTHYQDEFVETGFKDMIVRESISGYVPSCGVATSFSPEAIQTLSRLNNGVVFNTKSLTEDYDIGYRLLNEGLKLAFVTYPVKVIKKVKNFWGKEEEHKVEEYIVSKGYFPTKFEQAVRQKARWMVGIVFQGHRDIGWPKGLGLKYILYRDRKAIFTHPANLFAYIILLNLVVLTVSYMLDDTSWRFPEFMPEGSWIWTLVYFNALFLASRFFHRFYFVNHHYGVFQAVLSLPRLIWGNFVNMFALFRAFERYKSAGQEKKEVKWDKTDHEFPDEVEIAKVA